jgi:hypothetical protein
MSSVSTSDVAGLLPFADRGVYRTIGRAPVRGGRADLAEHHRVAVDEARYRCR